MRVAGVQQQAAPVSSSPWGSRVPQTGAQPAPNLPPIEPAADAFIAELFQKYPEARFRLTQTAFVQEHALVQAQNRIQELEWELEAQTRQAQAANSRGFLGLGGRLVTLPLGDLQWNAEREHIVMPGATKESLGSRPAFEYGMLRNR
eukprot:gene10198-12505_t